MATAIAVEGVSKRFVIHHERPRSFQEALIALVHRRNGYREEFWALRDVSFQVEQGEALGIIGPNGSGKSTILKLLTRILQPTWGEVSVRGRISALIELGAGFHPDLTGRENIFLSGSILGIGQSAMARHYDAIVAFSELERFIDTPVKHYSSGMYMRLGFAVAIHVEPDILIIDEVLAVGDTAFQEKCLATLDALKEAGKTLLLVSHDMDLIRRFCHRAIFLDHGEVQSYGLTQEAIARYMASLAR